MRHWPRAQSTYFAPGSLPSGIAMLQLEGEARRRPRASNAARCCRRRPRRRCLPATGPRCSSKVMTSAMIWQGCVSSVRPLITGTVAFCGQFHQPVMRGGADHDGVDIARQHLGGVGDGLAAAELHLGAGQHDGLAAELAHADVEGDARAGRRLVEDHRQHLALERARAATGLDLGLAAAGVGQHLAQHGRRKRRTGR